MVSPLIIRDGHLLNEQSS